MVNFCKDIFRIFFFFPVCLYMCARLCLGSALLTAMFFTVRDKKGVGSEYTVQGEQDKESVFESYSFNDLKTVYL